MKPVGAFELRDVDLAGRIARLHTPRGTLETPALLPVIDIDRQEVKVDEIAELGFRAVITNAYLLWKRYGSEIGKGVHRLLGFDGIVMTDSGAYQLLRYGRVEVGPEEIIEVQRRLGSDIAVILDVPSGGGDRERAEYAVEETLRRARLSAELIDSGERVWVLPVQGGPYPDLVERSARESRSIEGYQLYAFGSPTVLLERYAYSDLLDLVYIVRKTLPYSRPLHLFGAGHPMIIPFAVALGVDMFDSASYILYARDDRYMTLTRTYRLQDLDYFPCSCPVCTKYTPQELLEMPKPERTRLLALHNLHVLAQAIREAKTAIREGRLWELLEERSRAHPSLYTAFKKFKSYMDYLEKVSPTTKGGEVHGLMLYDELSLVRPRIARHRRRLLENLHPYSRRLILFTADVATKPITATPAARRILEEHEGDDIVAITPFMGLIPLELAETYPLSQFEAPNPPYPRAVAEDTMDVVTRFVEKHHYENIVLYIADVEWLSSNLEEELIERLRMIAEKTGAVLEVKRLTLKEP